MIDFKIRTCCFWKPELCGPIRIEVFRKYVKTFFFWSEIHGAKFFKCHIENFDVSTGMEKSKSLTKRPH